MPEEPLVAHSLAEAYLYLMATSCPACGRGPLKGADARLVDREKHATVVVIAATCDACRQAIEPMFKLSGHPSPETRDSPTVVNPTDEPSRILDAGQWITLFRMITEAAAKTADKAQARHLGLEAAQCLEEALKFYDDVDNDLPSTEALFTQASRQRFRDHPEQFSRRRLIELRSKLPSPATMRSRLASPGKKRWWRRG